MSDAATAVRVGIDEACVNAIRALAVDAVEAARSGHPGAPMGMAPVAFVLWTRFLRHDPADPAWPDRDRFVLSAGHASMLLYALLHLSGYDLPLDELRRFRQLGSRAPGHPEHGLTPGVETTTGPLGQGLANAVGMAIAERLLAERFNRPGLEVVDHRVWAICSDGDLMEGISHEAASLAGHLGLGRLTVVHDDNGISIDGPTDLAWSEDVAARFRAYGWHVERVEDGTDLAGIEAALARAREEEERPSLVMVRTRIAEGAPTKQGTAAAHGAPLGPDEVAAWREAVGWAAEPFDVPLPVRARFLEAAARGAAERAAWRRRFEAWAEEFPELAGEWRRRMRRELPGDLWEALPRAFDGRISTRKASGAVLSALVPALPELVGGSADLTESTATALPGVPASGRGRVGRYLHHGVREHGMAGVMNGLALHGGFRPYGGTFLVFSDYLRPALRLSAMMRQPVVYVFTHDSIGLGEDGPTHQPVEHLAALRAMPGLVVIRPADAWEVVEAWRAALERRDGPTALVLSRQDLPVLGRPPNAPADGLRFGAYVLRELGPSGEPDVVLLATGSEVHVALGAAEGLADTGLRARVVSMPSWELFEAQPREYREDVLGPRSALRVALEAGASLGWERWVGPGGVLVTLDRFGASAPGPDLMRRFGFTPEAVAERVLAALGRSGR
ncbi:MAG TPA: transketolase [Actinomycetota bacterium]|nr:transketolase [Actinomycetota bacterium]